MTFQKKAEEILSGFCHHLLPSDSDTCPYIKKLAQALEETWNEAIEEATKELDDAISAHYDPYKNDCAVCGAMLTKCKKYCIIPDLLECAKIIRTLRKRADRREGKPEKEKK